MAPVMRPSSSFLDGSELNGAITELKEGEYVALTHDRDRPEGNHPLVKSEAVVKGAESKTADKETLKVPELKRTVTEQKIGRVRE